MCVIIVVRKRVVRSLKRDNTFSSVLQLEIMFVVLRCNFLIEWRKFTLLHLESITPGIS